jgi:hypothetical protein
MRNSLFAFYQLALMDAIMQTTEISVKKNVKQKKEYNHDGIILPKKGQTIWEINLETEEITEAEYEKTTVAILNADPVPKKIIQKIGCIYIPAINKKNALKKFRKSKNQNDYLIYPTFSLK